MERMNFENVGRELERRGKAGDIKKLAESPDGQRVGRMVDAKALETAAKSGDSEADAGLNQGVSCRERI